MNTLGGTTIGVSVKEESYAINHGFICDAIAAKGTAVKLLSTGKVTPTTAVTDKPIGYLSIACKEADGEATVATKFSAIVQCTADGALAVGDEVYGSGSDNTNARPKYKKTVAEGAVVIGVVLTAAADTAVGVVGIYRSPEVIPTVAP